MKVKTVSRLPEATNIGSEDLFQLSKHVTGYDNRYNSVKIKYETVLSTIYDTVDEKISEKYNLSVDTIENINLFLESNGEDILYLSNNIKINQERIADLEEVTPEWDIKNMDSYINTETRKIIGSDFILFNFSKPDHIQTSTIQTINKTGNLFCYGFITAPKIIDPANAWVAIETKMNNSNNWAMIALQPWIIGDKSSVMQYVGFNCPVQANMQLRIRTGFQITDFSQSFSGRGLVLNVGSNAQGSNINNSFIGYILGGDEI